VVFEAGERHLQNNMVNEGNTISKLRMSFNFYRCFRSVFMVINHSVENL